jgi:hypothetical protein
LKRLYELSSKVDIGFSGYIVAADIDFKLDPFKWVVKLESLVFAFCVIRSGDEDSNIEDGFIEFLLEKYKTKIGPSSIGYGINFSEDPNPLSELSKFAHCVGTSNMIVDAFKEVYIPPVKSDDEYYPGENTDVILIFNNDLVKSSDELFKRLYVNGNAVILISNNQDGWNLVYDLANYFEQFQLIKEYDGRLYIVLFRYTTKYKEIVSFDEFTEIILERLRYKIDFPTNVLEEHILFSTLSIKERYTSDSI